jgi:pimeloyl-ACP methyl ester carboxylesterase
MGGTLSAASVGATVELVDGRTVGFATFGDPGGTPVLWCHGGPGSRMEPAYLGPEANDAGLLLVGIDRPGYGMSTPSPDRTISDWVPDAVAVADELNIDQFAAVGESTGGAYALALAALVPTRVLGVVPCCAMTDMRWEPARSTMSRAHCHAVWDAPDRESAVAAAAAAHGENGSKMLNGGMNGGLAASDAALFRDPEWMTQAMAAFPAMFTYGLEGFADDRRADCAGWVDFDVANISCPVTVLHGGADKICDVQNARYTAALIPQARLDIYDDLGHFSIVTKVIPTIRELLTR